MASPLPGAVLICSALDGQCCGSAARAVGGTEVLAACAVGVAAEVLAGLEPEAEHPEAAATTAAVRAEPASAETFTMYLILMAKQTWNT